MKKQITSLIFYIIMVFVSILNIILQAKNGTFYWGNALVLGVFVLLVIYKLYRLYTKEKISFVNEQYEDDCKEDDENTGE